MIAKLKKYLNPITGPLNMAKGAGSFVMDGYRASEGFLGDVAGSVGDILTDPFGRDFSANQAEIARDFSSREAALAREFSAEQAGITRDFSSREAQAARAHQEHMTRAAPGLTIQGFKDAGIHPLLAVGGGHSAAPPGPAASASNPQSHAAGTVGSSNPVSVLGDLSKIALLRAQARNIDADTDLKGAQASKVPWDIEEAKTRMYHLDSKVSLNNAMRRAWEADTDMTIAQLHEFMKGNVSRSTEEEFHRNAGAVYRWYQKWILPILNPASKFIPTTTKRR